MKKALKILLALALTLSLSLCLCSCIDLDEIRKTRVSYIGESQTEVTFRGNTYKQLDTKISEYLSSYELPDTAYATKDEVPLLLTEMFSEWVSYSENDTRLIQVEGIYYCREDLYQYAKDLLEKNEFEYPCFKYYNFETGEETLKMLDKSFIDTVNKIIDTVEPSKDYPDTYDMVTNVVTIMATDKEGLFMHGLFYVEQLEDGYFISMDNLADDIAGYIVPQKYHSQFEDLFPEDTEFNEFNFEV